MPTTVPRLACRLLLAAAVLLGAVAGVLAGAPPASAHASLSTTSPARDSVVGSAPALVSLTFSERVGMSDGSIRVLDPEGEQADTGTLKDQRSGDTVTYGVALKPDVPDGTYTVAWKAISADTHPISGAFTFSIGAPSKTSVGAIEPPTASASVEKLYTLGRYTAYTGFVLLAGGAVFVLGCWREGASHRSVQRLTVTGWLLITGATALLLLLRYPLTNAGGLSDALSLSGLRSVLETNSGSALVSRLLLLATAALFLGVLFGAYRRERTDKEVRDLRFGLAVGWTVVTAGIAATWAMSEHASTGLQPQVAMPVDVLHLLAVAVWFGGLAMLLTALYQGPAVPAEVVRRFSRMAFVAVVVLVATGVYQSWRQVGTWTALTTTEYGRLLVIKVGLMVVLTGIAYFSRRWTGRLAATPAKAEAGAKAEAEAEAEAAKAAVESAAAAETAESAAVSDADAQADEDAEATAEAGADAGERAGDRVTASVGARATTAGTTAEGSTEAPAAPEAATRDTAARADSPEQAETEQAGTEQAGTGPSPTEAPSDSDPAPAVPAPAADAAGDPARAAQLARQEAAVAAAQRRRERDADPVRRGLRRSVLAEAAVAAVLLAVTTQLTNTEPARTVENARSAGHATPVDAPREEITLRLPFDTGGKDGKGTAEVRLAPTTTSDYTLYVRTDVEAEEVRVAFSLPEKDLGPLPVSPESVMGDKTHWVQTKLQIPLGGEWEVAVTVRTSDVDQATATKKTRIG